MGKVFSLIVFLFFLENVYAQQTSPKDFLPLQVGNKWLYGFYTDGYGTMTHYGGNDSGVVEYKIIDKTVVPDSTLWRFRRTREYARSTYGSNEIQYLKDTLEFNLTEVTNGNHKLYLAKYDFYSLFPFHKTNVDSLKFYRFINSQSSKEYSLTLKLKTIDNSETQTFSLKADTGITRLISTGYYSISRASSRFYLWEFHSVYPDPHLSLPFRKVTLNGLARTSIDTTIRISNDGIQTINIESITSSNQSITILDFSKQISPSTDGFIKIRLNSTNAGIISAVLTINSNSVNTQNKISIIGNTYDAALIEVYPAYINFDNLYNGHNSSKTYSITNNGNINLIIDSVKTDNTVFLSKAKRITVPPNKTLQDTLYFVPYFTADHYGQLFFVSNANNSLRKIDLHGVSIEEPNVEVNLRSINMGFSVFGTEKDTTVVITNNGNESIDLTSTEIIDVESHNMDDYPIRLPNINSTLEIPPHSSYNQIITFTPKTDNLVKAMIILYYSKFGITFKVDTLFVTAGLLPDKFSLSQNYPNPFNSSTKINFRIASLSKVTLKIFDCLGRLVATLLNEQLLPGIYEKNISGNDLASGIYFYRLTYGDESITKKFVLLK